jgi:hypothetical protein
MPRIANRGFAVTLLTVTLAAELLLRAAASGPPGLVRVVYGTTLAMYMEIDKRLHDAAPNLRVLAMGDSLALTQFQPDVFAADHRLPGNAVFNASYLALTHRSQEMLLRAAGLERFTHLRHAILFVNPRRLTADGNIDEAVFRVAIADPGGRWRAAWSERSVSPLFDGSRLYGLSRYLVSASWRQIGRPTTWDEVEYLGAQGGVAYGGRGLSTAHGYPYGTLTDVSEKYVADLTRVIALFRSRGVEVTLLPSLHHPSAQPFAGPGVERQFDQRMRVLAEQTGSTWLPDAIDGFVPPAQDDYLDYGHLNREGGIAFTHHLRDRIPPIE